MVTASRRIGLRFVFFIVRGLPRRQLGRPLDRIDDQHVLAEVQLFFVDGPAAVVEFHVGFDGPFLCYPVGHAGGRGPVAVARWPWPGGHPRGTSD